jgi:hypothetical protein
MKHIPKTIVVVLAGLMLAASLPALAAEKEESELYTVDPCMKWKWLKISFGRR